MRISFWILAFVICIVEAATCQIKKTSKLDGRYSDLTTTQDIQPIVEKKNIDESTWILTSDPSTGLYLNWDGFMGTKAVALNAAGEIVLSMNYPRHQIDSPYVSIPVMSFKLSADSSSNSYSFEATNLIYDQFQLSKAEIDQILKQYDAYLNNPNYTTDEPTYAVSGELLRLSYDLMNIYVNDCSNTVFQKIKNLNSDFPVFNYGVMAQEHRAILKLIFHYRIFCD